MYKKILVPLDGSKTAENMLPYARCFSRTLQIPIELLAVVDAAELTRNISAAGGFRTPNNLVTMSTQDRS
jgi:nucleotide-binding universal stress UspA family protein